MDVRSAIELVKKLTVAPLAEEAAAVFRNVRGKVATVFKNPTGRELRAIYGRGDNIEAPRAYLVGNDILIWSASQALHAEVRSHFDLPATAIPVILWGEPRGQLDAMVTDSTRHTPLWHSPEVADEIIMHPYLKKFFSEIEVSYYDEDIYGDWEELQADEGDLDEDVATKSTAFERWFAGSKIVDAAGKPLKLYHGTSKDQDFRSFKMPKNGIWFTIDPSAASDYAKDNDSKGIKYDDTTRQYRDVHTASRVIPVYVRAEKVLYLDQWPDNIYLATNYRRQQGMYFDMLRFQGYDAVNYQNSVYVVIGSPNQIKSATGNRGSFDPAKKNIDEDAAVVASTVRLYHGTSSAFVEEIERFGLQALGGEGTYEHFCAIAQQLVPVLSDSLKRELRRFASYYRTPKIFLTPNRRVAEEHARDNAATGGEIGGEILRLVSEHEGVDEAVLAARMPRGEPTLVTLDIPADWLPRAITSGQYEVVLRRPEIAPEFIAAIAPV